MKSEEIVKIAKKYIGQTETQNNSGFNDKLFEQRMKDTGWIKGASWCSFFCELVWKEAYVGTPIFNEIEKLFSGSATATFKNFDLAKSSGWETGQTPKPGALAVWRLGNGWQGHIGIVIDVHQGKFSTIEGNTNDKGGREGYIVANKMRVLGGKYQPNGLNLIGFVYPK